MILLYTFLLLFLGAIKMLIDRRANALERRYSKVAKDADQLLREPVRLEGNSKSPDRAQSAKRQYQLGMVVQRRDRLEAAYDAWQARAEKMRGVIAWLRGWKGRTVPYTMGALDVSAVLLLVDALGAGEYLSAKVLLQHVMALLRV